MEIDESVKKYGNCLVQPRTYAPTGNRDLEKISIAFLIQSVDLLHYARGSLSHSLCVRLMV